METTAADWRPNSVLAKLAACWVMYDKNNSASEKSIRVVEGVVCLETLSIDLTDNCGVTLKSRGGRRAGLKASAPKV